MVGEPLIVEQSEAGGGKETQIREPRGAGVGVAMEQLSCRWWVITET